MKRRSDEFLSFLVQQDALEGPLSDIDGDLLAEGYLDERELLSYLASFYDHRPAGYGDGLYVEPELWDEIELSWIEEHALMPVRRRDRGIDVLVTEPLEQETRQALEEALGADVRPYIWPHARFEQARHVLLDAPLSPTLRDYLRDNPVSMGFSRPQDIALDKAIAQSTSLGAEDWSDDDLHAFIDQCLDRDALLKVLLGRSARWLSPRMLAIHHSQGLKPYFVEDCPRLDDELKRPEKLRDISAKDPHQLFDRLGLTKPDQLFDMGIHIGGRKALILFGVPVDQTSALRLEPSELSEDRLAPLRNLVDRVGEQLTEIIHLTKSLDLPPPQERIPTLPQPQRRRGLGDEDSLTHAHLARRDHKERRHRWEIVDISEAKDTSLSEPSESPFPPMDTPEQGAEESSVVEAIADALSSPEELTPSSQAMLSTESSETFSREDEDGTIRSTGGHAVQEDPTQEPEDEATQKSGPSLNIPNGPSGLPLAQILRRPPSISRERKRASSAQHQAAQSESQSDEELDRSFVTGETVQGTGQIKSLSEADPSSTISIFKPFQS